MLLLSSARRKRLERCWSALSINLLKYTVLRYGWVSTQSIDTIYTLYSVHTLPVVSDPPPYGKVDEMGQLRISLGRKMKVCCDLMQLCIPVEGYICSKSRLYTFISAATCEPLRKYFNNSFPVKNNGSAAWTAQRERRSGLDVSIAAMKSPQTAHVIPKICEVRWATRRTSARDEGWKQATGATELKMSTASAKQAVLGNAAVAVTIGGWRTRQPRHIFCRRALSSCYTCAPSSKWR